MAGLPSDMALTPIDATPHQVPRPIRVFGRADVVRSLDYRKLIDALAEGFRRPPAPPIGRTVTPLAQEPHGLLVTMAVWGGVHGAVKLATVFPGNPSQRELPAIHAQILLFDALTGEPLALVDGTETTLRRTAAASALAASHLALAHADSLLVIGTGALAPHLIAAHTLVRPIRHVMIWGRSHAKAAALAEAVGARRPDLVVEAAEDPAIAAARAQIISCATSAATPVLAGGWLSPGAHVDLVGGFSPQAREADDAVVRHARLFVDTRAGALSEAGDLLIPLASGVISPGAILGELSELCRGEVPGRISAHDITVFKSVGAAIEDLIAAQLVLQRNPEALE